MIHLSSFYKEGNIEESNFSIQWLCELFSMNIYIWSIESQTFSLMLHSMIVSSKMLYLMCEPLTSSHPHFHLFLEFHSRDSCVNWCSATTNVVIEEKINKCKSNLAMGLGIRTLKILGHTIIRKQLDHVHSYKIYQEEKKHVRTHTLVTT